MSKRGTSTRERRIDTIIDHLRAPAFRMRDATDPRSPYPTFVVEPTMARVKPDFSATVVDTAMIVFERFDDKKRALFVRDRKNAEAMMNAIERIGSDKRRP